MSEDLAASSDPGGVSPARKKASAVILCILLGILLIEVRAGAGHSMSGKALQETCPEGAFEKTALSDVEAMMKLSPTRTVMWESPAEIEYRYSWFSLLRPLLQRPEAALYVVSNKDTDPVSASRYNTEAPSPRQITAANEEMKRLNAPVEEASSDAADGGGFGGPGGPGGGGGPPAESRPPEDPTVQILDTDGDGTLTATELEGASDALFAADKNGDGKLTPDEIPIPAPGGAPEGRRRPELDDSEETVPEPKTEEPKTEEPKTEEPKTEEPKTEEPKTEEPKTEEPKTEEPKTEEPKTEEPKTEEPKTEEPKTEEPKTEEPAEPAEESKE